MTDTVSTFFKQAFSLVKQGNPTVYDLIPRLWKSIPAFHSSLENRRTNFRLRPVLDPVDVSLVHRSTILQRLGRPPLWHRSLLLEPPRKHARQAAGFEAASSSLDSVSLTVIVQRKPLELDEPPQVSDDGIRLETEIYRHLLPMLSGCTESSLPLFSDRLCFKAFEIADHIDPGHDIHKIRTVVHFNAKVARWSDRHMKTHTEAVKMRSACGKLAHPDLDFRVPGMHRAFIALGSNLGDRWATLEAACRELQDRGVSIKRTSSMFESAAMYITDQPDFLNAVCEVGHQRHLSTRADAQEYRLKQPWAPYNSSTSCRRWKRPWGEFDSSTKGLALWISIFFCTTMNACRTTDFKFATS